MASATQEKQLSSAQAAPTLPADPSAVKAEGVEPVGAPSTSSEVPTGTRKSKKSNPSSTSPPPSSLTKATPPTNANTRSTPANGTNGQNGNGKKPKRSFWAGLRSLILPCIPSPDGKQAHDIDLGTGVPPSKTGATGTDTAAAKEVTGGQEKQLDEKKAAALPVVDATSHPKSTSSASGTAGAEPSTPTRTKPSPLVTTAVVGGQDGDAMIVIPPSPHSHLLPHDETEGVTSGAVQPPGGTGAGESLLHPPITPHLPHGHHPSTTTSGTITSDSDVSITDENEGDVADNEGGNHGAGTDLDVEDEDDEEERLILAGGTGIPIGPDGQPCPLLPPLAPHHKGRKCLVLDLDETLLHSSFKLIPQADYVVPVEIEWQWHNVYVIKRPGVDNFLKQMGELYEVVIFTASLSKYADPVLDKLDIHKVVAHRLFRESCYNHKGSYVKDLSRLGRPVEDMIILDNSPASYIFHPNNAVPVSSWFNDPHDTELTDLCPFLADLMSVEDVRGVLDGGL
ncbi:hypothetical protein FRB96_005021 [Tulasnella sp. 330]|nr:hypothetical protein FRB96_005021 [Tulasnella sp. 330]KAG8878170.1 hypothetical protein FRB97_002721 [Tulasnella sp. 331]KAG8883535.1 hypothetical protein FRB98_003096 [Tulasnella sp. 332]